MPSAASEEVRDTFRILLSVLRDQGIDFALIGALARGAWAEPRATTDVDVQISVDSGAWDRLARALAASGFALVKFTPPVEPTDPVPDQAFFRSRVGVRADLLVAKTAFEREALARRVIVAIMGDPVPVVTAEDLIVYKVLAGRPRDVSDVVAVIEAADASARSIDWGYVDRWCELWQVSDRLADVRALVRST